MTRTVDEVLTDAGLTREEWQRAHKLVEEEWQFFARMCGWAPKPRPYIVQFPVAGKTIRIVWSEAPTPEDWDRMVTLLEAMRPALAQATTEGVATK